MEEAPDPLKAVSDAADIIGKHGAERTFTALWVLIIATAISLAVWYFYRRMNNDYIHKDKILDHIKDKNPEILNKTWKELPDLRSHETFGTWQKELREASTVVIYNLDGSENKLKTDLARDMISWSIRGYRDVIKTLLTFAYDDKDGFESYFGNSKECLNIMENTYLDANEGIRVRLVEELNFPISVWEKMSRFRSRHHELMNKMFILAINNHNMNYWRINEALNSYFAAADSMSEGVCAAITKLDNSIEYDRSPEATLMTRGSGSSRMSDQNKYAPRIYEGMYNPKSR